MKITKRKSCCLDCRALRNSFGAFCELKYPIAYKRKHPAGLIPYPAEKCPKPKTINDLLDTCADLRQWGYNKRLSGGK